MAITAAAIIGGAGLVGGLLSSNAASDAANAQTQAANTASQTQLQMFNTARGDQMPWLTRGNEAGNLLNTYLGLPGAGGAYDLSAYGVGPAPTLAQYTTTTNSPGLYSPFAYLGGGGGDQGANGTPRYNYQPVPQSTSTVDQVGYQNALAAYNAQRDAALKQLQSDPRFGSLLRPFTGANLASDPGYQFGLHQGENAVTDRRAALGSLLSGATLKDLTQFGNDYAGTKFNEAFNRDLASKQLTYNQLAGVSGTGQATAQQVGNQTLATGNQLAENTLGAGNARASSYIGSANAYNSALGAGANAGVQGMFLNNYLGAKYPATGSAGATGSQYTGSVPYSNLGG